MNKQTPHNAGRGPGHRFILSAPSGAGKTTLCRAVLSRFPDMRYSISHTTRAPRPGEQDGVDYHFISQRTFDDLLARNRWAEWATVHGNRYGTSADFLDENAAAGRDVLLDIDVQGARQILARYPVRTVTVFVMPPSAAVLRKRLESRGADSPEQIARRMENALEEMQQKNWYDHVIVNDQLEAAAASLCDLIQRHRVSGSREQTP